MKAIIGLIAILACHTEAIQLQPNRVSAVQLHSSQRLDLQATSQLFTVLSSKLRDIEEAAAKKTPEGDKQATLSAEAMDDVVDRVQERWLGSIDKEEPEIVDEFLQKMKEAVSAVHQTESRFGGPYRRVAKSREDGDDWLTKIVETNSKMQSMIPGYDKTNRVAIYDS